MSQRRVSVFSRKNKKFWRRALERAILAEIMYVFIILARIGYAGAGDSLTKADAVVVLGAAQFNGRPSAVYRARLDHAIEIYQMGLVDHIVFTGGKAPGDTYSEASAGRLYALQKGIPDAAILEETLGRTTIQSLHGSNYILKQNGLKTAILVSDPFHAFRLRRMASDLGMRFWISPVQNTRIQSPLLRAKFALREVYAYTAYIISGF